MFTVSFHPPIKHSIFEPGTLPLSAFGFQDTLSSKLKNGQLARLNPLRYSSFMDQVVELTAGSVLSPDTQALGIFPSYYYHKVAATILSIKFPQLYKGWKTQEMPEILCPMNSCILSAGTWYWRAVVCCLSSLNTVSGVGMSLHFRHKNVHLRVSTKAHSLGFDIPLPG